MMAVISFYSQQKKVKRIQTVPTLPKMVADLVIGRDPQAGHNTHRDANTSHRDTHTYRERVCVCVDAYAHIYVFIVLKHIEFFFFPRPV